MNELQKVRHINQHENRMEEMGNHFNCSDGKAK